MDLRYMLTLEKIINCNNKYSEIIDSSFITVYKNKKHLSESMSSLHGLGEKLERFDNKFDVIITVGNGKGYTKFFKEDECLEAWEQYRDFVSIDKQEYDKKFKYERKNMGVFIGGNTLPSPVSQFNNEENKNKRIEGWDEF